MESGPNTDQAQTNGSLPAPSHDTTLLPSAEIPELSIFSGQHHSTQPDLVNGTDDFSSVDRHQDQVDAPTFGTPNGTTLAFGPVTPPVKSGPDSLSLDSMGEVSLLRNQIENLKDQIHKLKQTNKSLTQEKQEAVDLANSHCICNDDLKEKNHNLERENDDYLRNIVSANKKVEFYEKNWREMRLKCQSYEEILRQNGLLPGADGPPVSSDPSVDALISSAKNQRQQLEALLMAQHIKLNKLVQQSGHKPGARRAVVSVDPKAFASMPAASQGQGVPPLVSLHHHQGARQKTRPATLIETSEAAWPALPADKPLVIDKTGTKPWCEAERHRPRWMPEDDRSLNAWERQYKEQRLDNWIRDLQPDADVGEDDKDYVFVPQSSNLPTSNPNSGCQTFPRRRTDRKPIHVPPPQVPDMRGSMAPVYGPETFKEENRTCPVCDMEFSDIIPLQEYESHVAVCCERTSSRDVHSPQLNSPVLSPVLERTCPVCSGDFSSSAQSQFESHVNSHFEDETGEGAVAQTRGEAQRLIY